MSKKDHVRTVVVGGKQDVQQQYCGIVGGQSTNFVMVDTEVKVCGFSAVMDILAPNLLFQSTGLKNHSLAPPDL